MTHQRVPYDIDERLWRNAFALHDDDVTRSGRLLLRPLTADVAGRVLPTPPAHARTGQPRRAHRVTPLRPSPVDRRDEELRILRRELEMVEQRWRHGERHRRRLECALCVLAEAYRDK